MSKLLKWIAIAYSQFNTIAYMMRESYIWRARRYFWHGARKLVMVTWAILSTLMEKYLRVRELRAPRAYTISLVADSWSYMRDGWIDDI